MMLRLTMVRRVAAPDEVAAEQLAQCARAEARVSFAYVAGRVCERCELLLQ
jgi:hypothetical protein